MPNDSRNPNMIPADHDRTWLYPIEYQINLALKRSPARTEYYGWHGQAFDSVEAAESFIADYFAANQRASIRDIQRDYVVQYVPVAWRDYLRIPSMYGLPDNNYPVWSRESWWLSAIQDDVALADHCVVMSSLHPGLLAYVQNEDKGIRNVRTAIKPGRYLTQFFADKLTAKQIAFYAAWQATGHKPDQFASAEIHYATTPDDIERVYKNGPDSCMSGGNSAYSSDVHPTRVYGAGDLAIAYLRHESGDESVIARALCWPERKVYGRVYGRVDAYDSLTNKLQAAGFTRAGTTNAAHFNGARLLRINAGNSRVVMPYLDWNYHFQVGTNGYLELNRTEGYSGSETCGLAYCDNSDHDDDDDDDDDMAECDNCESRVNQDDTHTVYTRCDGVGTASREQSWCTSCRENHAFYCESVGETFAHSVDTEIVEDEIVPAAYAHENAFQCYKTGDWYWDESEVRVNMDSGDAWCVDAFAEHGFCCLITSRNMENSDMHKEHPGIANDCEDDEIADYFAKLEAARIDDVLQMTLATL